MSKKLEADGEVEIKEMGLRGGRSKRTPERIEWSWRGKRPQSVRREVDDEEGATGSREEARLDLLLLLLFDYLLGRGEGWKVKRE